MRLAMSERRCTRAPSDSACGRHTAVHHIGREQGEEKRREECFGRLTRSSFLRRPVQPERLGQGTQRRSSVRSAPAGRRRLAQAASEMPTL